MGNFAENLNLGNRFRPHRSEDVDLLYSWAFLSESFAITIIIKRDYQW